MIEPNPNSNQYWSSRKIPWLKRRRSWTRLEVLLFTFWVVGWDRVWLWLIGGWPT